MARWWEANLEQHEQLEAAREPGEYIPGYDDSRPRLNAFELWLWRNYRQLASQRGDSFGPVPAPIPISEMRHHWEWLGLGDVCEPAEFEAYMSLLDRETRVFRSEVASKDKQQEEETE